MHVIRPLIIAALVMTEVGLWQWRMVVADRGNRAAVMLLGTVGAILQITAISQVVTDLGDPLSIAAYAGGVGVGVLLGLLAGDRFTPGTISVTISTRTPGLADRLWSRGWPATVQVGYGVDGPIDIVSLAIARNRGASLRAEVLQVAPDGQWRAVDLGPTRGTGRVTPRCTNRRTRLTERPPERAPLEGIL